MGMKECENAMAIHFRTVMQCPACGFKTTEKMPSEKKIVCYQCEACGINSCVSQEQCCVFCAWARDRCPEQQKREQ